MSYRNEREKNNIKEKVKLTFNVWVVLCFVNGLLECSYLNGLLNTPQVVWSDRKQCGYVPSHDHSATAPSTPTKLVFLWYHWAMILLVSYSQFSTPESDAVDRSFGITATKPTTSLCLFFPRRYVKFLAKCWGKTHYISFPSNLHFMLFNCWASRCLSYLSLLLAEPLTRLQVFLFTVTWRNLFTSSPFHLRPC